MSRDASEIRCWLDAIVDIGPTIVEVEGYAVLEMEDRPDPNQPCAMKCGRTVGDNPKRALAGLICPTCASLRFDTVDPRIQRPR